MYGVELDNVERARREMDDLIENIDLDPGQEVCVLCNLVYWVAAGPCTNCHAWD